MMPMKGIGVRQIAIQEHSGTLGELVSVISEQIYAFGLPDAASTTF